MIKRCKHPIIVAIFALTLVFSCGIIAYGAPINEETGDMYFDMGDTVKAGLFYGTTAKQQYSLTCIGGFTAGVVTKGKFTEHIDLEQYSTLVVELNAGNVVLKDDSGNILIDDLEDYTIMPVAYEESGFIHIEGTPYRGGMCFNVSGDSSLNAVNHLSIEHYVYGVLNAEMHHTNPLEALKAQAIAARSFAYSNIDRHSQYGFDVCNTTHCQVYNGYLAEKTSCNQAVDETKGICLYYENKPVSAYYFKNSGGYTQSIEDVWGSSAGYLVAVKDEYSPDYNWNLEYSFGEIENILSAADKNIGKLQKIEITDRNRFGTVAALRFVGSSDSVTYSGEKMRSLLGATKLKSTNFSISNTTPIEGVDEEQPISERKGVFVQGGLSALSSKAQVLIVGNNGVREIQNTSAIYVTNGNKTVKGSSLYTDTASRGDGSRKDNGTTATEVLTEGPLVISGSGYGHGIGMPQDSAIEMAKQGFTFEDILKYYYTDIELK